MLIFFILRAFVVNMTTLSKKRKFVADGVIPGFSTPKKRYTLCRSLAKFDHEAIRRKNYYYQVGVHVIPGKLLVVKNKRDGKKPVYIIMNPSYKLLLGAVIGTVIGVVVGYNVPKMGVTVGGLVGCYVGSSAGTIVAASIDVIEYN